MSALKEALVARVSYLRPAVTAERTAPQSPRRLTETLRRRGPGPWVAGGLLLVVVAGAVVGLILISAKVSLSGDADALARVGMPLGGGTITRATVVTGPHSRRIPIEVRGDQIWPRQLIPAHQLVTIEVVVKRPGWSAWLAGNTQRL